jgi:hypothetical protein
MVIFNKTHWDPNSKSFKRFFTSNKTFHNKKVALQSLSLYNSFFNISAANNNNYITFDFLGSTYIHTFDDGYYSVDDINYALQKTMIANKTYVNSANGSNVFFLELATNSVRYGIQINAYAIPISADATTRGYTKPTGATWSYPVTAQTPTITFGSQFGSIIGQAAGTYPTDTTQDSGTVSTFSPQLSVVNSLLLTCNLVSSDEIPHNSFFSFGLNAEYGKQLEVNPYPFWKEIKNGSYQFVEIHIYDQNLVIQDLYDVDGNITLAIEDDKNM